MAKATTRIRGHMKIDIPDDGSRASLVIERADDGQEISDETVLALIKSRNVQERIPADDISRLLREFSVSSSQTAEIVVARAKQPKPGSGEAASIIGLVVPPELRASAEARLAEAGAPEIHVDVTERVKVQKVVEKKAALPFLPPKKETIEQFEKKVTRKRVYVDPETLGSGFVRAGTKVGDVVAGKAGEPGRDVLGRPLPPATLPDPFFYAGRGIERKRDELVAAEMGIVRWGRNWIELIPFRSHEWSVTVSGDKATCLLAFHPGHSDAPRPAATEIIAAAVKAGYRESMLRPAAEIERLVGQAIRHGKPAENIPICVDFDAQVNVIISEDALTATLEVRKGSGKGTPLRLKDVGAAITAAGLKGLNLAQIKEDLTAFAASAELELSGYALCQGSPPRKGSDSVVEFSTRPFADAEIGSQKQQLEQSADCAAEFSALLTKESVLEATSKAAPDGTPGARSPRGAEASSESAKAGEPAPTGTETAGPNASHLPVPLEFPNKLISEISPVLKEQRIASFSEPTVGDSGVDVHGRQLPGIPGTTPRFALYGGIVRQQNLIVSAIDGVLDRGALEDGTILLRVRPHRNASVDVSIAQDKMSATVSVTERAGCGKPLDGNQIDAAIERAGIRKGIDSGVLGAAKMAAATGDAFAPTVVANGKPAQGAGHRELRFLVEMATGKGVRIREDGSADYRNQDRMTRVAAGTEIAEILAPSGTPEDGYDITGKVLGAASATQVEITPGPNIESREQADGRTVFAARVGGEVVYENHLLDVRSTHTVKGDVDLQSGNIKFSGPVTVTGSVSSGFYVMATGEVRIGGGVDAALVSSDDNILVKEGVRGAGKAVLRSKKSISMAFAEQAVLLSVGDIVINNACMQSRVKCNGRLLLRSDKGILIGGTIQVRNGLEAQNIGSERGAKTYIEFGQNFLIADQIETETKAIEQLKLELGKTEQQLAAAEHHHRADEMAALFRRKTQVMKALEKRNLKVFTLREKFEEHFESEIRVRGTIYPGTVIESHGRQLEITSQKKAVAFTFNTSSGRVEEKTLEK